MRPILAALVLLCVCAGCTEEALVSRQAGTGQQTLSFGFRDFDPVRVETRVGLPPIAEHRVMSIFLMIFDASGRIAYRKYFDHNNKVNDAEALLALPNDEVGWWVDNRAGGANHTRGGIKFRSKPLTGARLVLLANCQTDIMNISPERLQHIRTLDELNALKSAYNVLSLMRNGTLQMTGSTVVDIDDDGNITFAGDPATDPTDTYTTALADVGACVGLVRNDAKVTVRVGVVPGAPTTRRHVYGDGTEYNVTQVIESFEPTSWRVMNLPDEAWLMPHYGPSSVFGKAVVNSETYEFEGRTTEQNASGYTYDPSDTEYEHPMEAHNLTRDLDTLTFYTLESENAFKVGASTTGKTLKSDAAYDKYGKKLEPDGTITTLPRESPEWAAKQIALRDLQKKRPSNNGEYQNNYGAESLLDDDGGAGRNVWEFAPAKAPLLVIKGVVTMKHKEEDSAAPQTLSANVTYYVHLGDFLTDVDDYNTLRNTHYTYTINIRGVNSIQVEVERDNMDGEPWSPLNERQPGAMGRVYVAEEEIVTYDAHYGQRAYRFHADALLRIGKVDKLTWSVYSPFGRNGEPDRVGVDEVEVPNGLDYQWVHFMRNSKTGTYTELPDAAPENRVTVTDPGWSEGYYSQLQRWYPGDQYKDKARSENPYFLMDVLDLCQWLRREAKHYKELKEAHVGMPEAEFNELVARETAFDKNREIWVTAFVNEFYYEEDPISLTQRHSLWHDFTNEEHRAMHIMCDAHISRDGDSKQVGTAVTLYQRAIQTIYNTQYATEGWGLETVDETSNKTRKFYKLSEKQTTGCWSPGVEVGFATDNDNGRYNTARILGITTGSEQLRWKDYMQYHIDNKSAHMGDYGEMLPEKAAMRYSWLRRNRDNNGDGIINPDEIRWYIASINQLKELNIGDQGITSSAHLYDVGHEPNEMVTIEGNNYWKWRSHVVSSTVTKATSNKVKDTFQPLILWAEEGVSTSNYGNEWAKTGRLGIRCVRNLDETNTPRSITNPADHPYSIIQMTGPDANGYYTFDLSRMNDRSKNMNITTEPLPMDEKSMMSRPVNRFQTGPLHIAGVGMEGYSTRSNADGNKFSHLQADLYAGINLSPNGFRTPTLREMLVIHSKLHTVSSFWTGADKLGCANYYSFGDPAVGGNGFDVDGGKRCQTWSFQQSTITIDEAGVKIRTVRTLE